MDTVAFIPTNDNGWIISAISPQHMPSFKLGLWRGGQYFGQHYDHSTESVRVLRELWETGQSDLKGEFFRMDACQLSPRPARAA